MCPFLYFALIWGKFDIEELFFLYVLKSFSLLLLKKMEIVSLFLSVGLLSPSFPEVLFLSSLYLVLFNSSSNEDFSTSLL